MSWDWVDETDKKQDEERSKDYFNIVEGAQQFVLLSPFAKLAQVWQPSLKKYRIAEEGDENVSIKGVCWVLQDGVIKSAKMPYPVVKAIRALAEDPEWDFEIPFPRVMTLRAKNAKTKEVEYSLTPSPKVIEIPRTILDELAKKPTPEDIVEKMKGVRAPAEKTDYPEPEDVGINPEDNPWN